MRSAAQTSHPSQSKVAKAETKNEKGAAVPPSLIINALPSQTSAINAKTVVIHSRTKPQRECEPSSSQPLGLQQTREEKDGSL